MAQFRITGGTPLHGEFTVSGRKNAALKLIAATILSDQPVILHRVPKIQDVAVMLQILQGMGASVEYIEETSLRIVTSNIASPVIPADLGRKLRASLVLAGPLLARFGQVSFPHPGGDVIGKRSIEPHLKAFEQLGATVNFDPSTLVYDVKATHLGGQEIYLKESSVTGTENLIMAATRASGTTTIYNAAQEPHIVNLCNLLRAMGFQINGDGSSTVVITGSPDLSTRSSEITVIPDDLEVGTYAIAAVITQGNVLLHGVGEYTLLMPILSLLDDFNVQYSYSREEQTLHLLPSPNLRGALVRPQPWPAFPSDLGSAFTVLATQATGTSMIHEWMYEGRLYFVDFLQRMGANVVICDPHRALVNGPTKLSRSTCISPDIRAGAAMVLAALIAEGESTVEHIEIIERGYDRIDERMRSLGAKIVRE